MSNFVLCSFHYMDRKGNFRNYNNKYHILVNIKCGVEKKTEK